MRRPVLALVLLSFVTFFLGLGRQAITDSDEAFYAEAAREMVEGGDWLTPRFNYEDRWQKPVLYYWLTAATYLIAGPSEAAARVWSALAGLGLVLLAAAMARRTTGDDNAGWLAGAIVATCYGCFAMARLALPDLLLAFFITLTIWSILEWRWTAAGAAAGLGFLTKGPLAIVVPALVLLPIWWRERAGMPSRREALRATVAFAVLGLPWYVAMGAAHGGAYLSSFFVGDNLERFATDRFNEPRPVWFYLPIVLGGMLPWSVYLILLAWPSVRGVVTRTQRVSTETWRLLAWTIAPLLLFTLSVGKQPRYILPVLPPLAVLLGRSLQTQLQQSDGTPRRLLAMATWATAALYAVLAVLLFRAEPLLLSAHRAVTYAGICLIAASAVALAWTAAVRRWRALFLVMPACATALLVAVQFGAVAGLRPEPVEQMAALVRQHRRAGERVGSYHVFVRNLIFYTRVQQVELPDEGHALDFLGSPDRVLLAVRAADLPRLEAISGIRAVGLGELRYLDPSNVRLRTLLSPLPEQDVETILLVANR